MYLEWVLEETREQALNCIPKVLDKPTRYWLQTLYHTKGIRQQILFDAARAVGDYDPYEVARRGAALQLIHDSTLIIDGVLDHDMVRRGQRSLHLIFGRVIALAVAAWFNAQALKILEHSPRLIRAVSDLLVALAEGEAEQWLGRRWPRPICLERWERIALNDTGALFRFAVILAGYPPDPELNNLALAYHGLDDIQDRLGGALEGGGDADFRDNIPTLLDVMKLEEAKVYLKRLLFGDLTVFKTSANMIKSLAEEVFV